MDEQELKASIEKELRQKVPDWLWDQLKEERWVADVRNDEISRDDLVGQIRRDLAMIRRAGRSSFESASRVGQEVVVQEEAVSRLDDYEDERAEAYSAYLAKVVAGDRRAQRLRKRYSRRKTQADLRRLCNYLSGRYPWSEDEAERFVLTGERPEVAPLSGRVRLSGNEYNLFSYGTITLTVEPWVDAQSVERFYRELQGRVLGRKPRRGERRNLAIFRFVVEQSKSVGWTVTRAHDEKVGYFTIHSRELVSRPSWGKLCELWNERYPEGHKWHCKGRGWFQRDFDRAASVVPLPVTYEAFDRLSPDPQEGDAGPDTTLTPPGAQPPATPSKA